MYHKLILHNRKFINIMQVKFRYGFRCVDNLWLKIAIVLLELVEKMLGQNKKK